MLKTAKNVYEIKGVWKNCILAGSQGQHAVAPLAVRSAGGALLRAAGGLRLGAGAAGDLRLGANFFFSFFIIQLKKI